MAKRRAGFAATHWNNGTNAHSDLRARAASEREDDMANDAALQPREYRAICFDLDGTLLPMDIDEFMNAYFKRITSYMVAHGLDGEKFMEALKAGTKAMATHPGEVSNKEAFWTKFSDVYGVADDAELESLMELADGFYDKDFPSIGEGFDADPAAGRAVSKLVEKGYPVLLTTMPMFPRRAVEHRLAWAGVDPSLFQRITSYENSRSVKPREAYYAENLAAMGAAGEDVLMVGNNTVEDLTFMKLGADGFLVTDWLLDPIGFDIDSVKHGSLVAFEEWVDALPPCANPVPAVKTTLIDSEATQEALQANECRAGVNESEDASENASESESR